MLRLGVIGTSWICHQFIDAAQATEKYELTAVYSRSLTKAAEFVSDFTKVQLFDDLTDFVRFDGIDVIYIASPNSLHFSQTKAAIEAGKNVIVEKPAFSNPTEFDEIFEMALQKNVFVLEAARHIHDVAFQTVENFLADKTVIGANLTYAKYSSKMPALLAGELPNKWNPKFSGGILADLGVYLLYWALGQFGPAESAHYNAQLLLSGVDVSGHGLLCFKNFDVALYCAGNSTSFLPSEVYTTDGTLILDSVATLSKLEFIKLDGSREQIEIEVAENPLFAEADTFANFLSNLTDSGNCQKFTEWFELSRLVNRTSYAMRQDASVKFEAD